MGELEDELDHLQEELQEAQRSAVQKAKANENQSNSITKQEICLNGANAKLYEHQVTSQRLRAHVATAAVGIVRQAPSTLATLLGKVLCDLYLLCQPLGVGILCSCALSDLWTCLRGEPQCIFPIRHWGYSKI